MFVTDWLSTKLGQDIWTKKYCYNNETFDQWLYRVSGGNEKIRSLILQKKFLFGGRTLANRGTGKGSLSNCYCSGRVPDSLSEILETTKNIALTFKAQGGQGLSLSDIRPKGSVVNGEFRSDGIVPFMELFNTTAASISQGGSRRGALMMSIDIEHPESKTFIKIKEADNKINNANLSVEIGDRFMKAVETYYKTGETITYEVSNTFKGATLGGYEIIPIELYKLVMGQAWKSAEPGVMFMEKFRNYNLMEKIPDYNIETSNPCGEQPLPRYGACNLSSINLSEYVINPFADDADFDMASFTSDLYSYVRAMDDIVTENSALHALPEQREFSENYRNIGIGVMGIADMLLKMGIVYGSEKSIDILDRILHNMFRSSVFASSLLAKERGNFPKYHADIWRSSIIYNHFSSEEIELLEKQGLRNASLLSIAPTGSIGTMLEISTGVEPFFATKYKRKTISLTGDQETFYDVEIQIVQEFNSYEDFAKRNQQCVVTSSEIKWRDRINIQAILQKHIDTAISSTVNLPKETTVEEIEQLYLYAWQKGLKGITIYRDGSRQPILSTETTTINKKRPEVLDAKVVRFKNESENWMAVIGVLNGKPYEIFTGLIEPDEFPLPKYVENGKIVKVKLPEGKRYDFVFTDKYGYENRLGGLSRVFKKEYWNYAKLISALLRNEVTIDKIVKIIDGLDLNSELLNTWKNGIKRALKSFIADGTSTGEICPECGEKMMYIGGCVSCVCGNSKCG